MDLEWIALRLKLNENPVTETTKAVLNSGQMVGTFLGWKYNV